MPPGLTQQGQANDDPKRHGDETGQRSAQNHTHCRRRVPAEVAGHDDREYGRRLRRLNHEHALQLDANRKKQGNVVPTEGSTTPPKPNDETAFVRQLFGSGA